MRRANCLISRGGSFRSTLSAMTEPTASCSKSCLSADALSAIIPAPSSSDVGVPAAASNLLQGRDHLYSPAGAPSAERTPIPGPRGAAYGTTTLRPMATAGCTVASAAAAAQAASGAAASHVRATLAQPPLNSWQLHQTLDGLQLRGSAAFGGGGVRSFAASASGSRRSPDPVAEVVDASEAARRVMEDPVSRLLASQGMPVGLSLGAGAAGRGAASGRRTPGDADADAQADGGEDGDDPSKPPRADPAYQMEAFSDMLHATAAAARRGGPGEGDGSSSGGSGGDDAGFTAGVQRVSPSLDDSWGTTRESPADIARRIVESNLEAERERRGGTVGDDDDGDGDDEVDGPSMALSPSEQKYASLEAMSAEIKKLDEVFEVLASVPWLDEDVLSEKELKGMAQVGLLGTLEEVGFNIRPQLLRIWSGERGAELAAGPGLEFRDQAALMAILYHTQQIEDAHGPPPRGYMAAPLGGDNDDGPSRR